MDTFIGRWEQINEDIINIDAFLDAAGISDEVRRKIKTTLIIEYQCDGKAWKHTVTDKRSKASQSYSFELGVPVVSSDLFGLTFKVVITLESANKMKETYTEWCDSVVNAVKEVSGDVMTVSRRRVLPAYAHLERSNNHTDMENIEQL